MDRQDAYYYLLMLTSGFSDGYDDWLNGYLEAEDPLSDIVLELAMCGSDVSETARLLHNYCREEEFDTAPVCERLRFFLKEAYLSGRLTKAEVINAMYSFAENNGDPFDCEWSEAWFSMSYMGVYYEEYAPYDLKLADRIFEEYLMNGTPINSPSPR